MRELVVTIGYQKYVISHDDFKLLEKLTSQIHGVKYCTEVRSLVLHPEVSDLIAALEYLEVKPFPEASAEHIILPVPEVPVEAPPSPIPFRTDDEHVADIQALDTNGDEIPF
jgi:hypothetical protein